MSKIALEVALAEFGRFVEDMDLNVDESQMDDESKNGFLNAKDRIVREIQRGNMVINENGEPVYTPHRPASKHKEPITFHERTGSSLMAMDGKKENQNVRKMYAMMGEMCKEHPKVFAGLVGTDIKVCEATFQLLMD